jgi:hypothetical protein
MRRPKLSTKPVGGKRLVLKTGKQMQQINLGASSCELPFQGLCGFMPVRNMCDL